MADFAIAVNNFLESKYFNQVEEIKETDLLSWHVFVSNKIDNVDADIVKAAFDELKADKKFVKNLEKQFHIFKFSEKKDSIWLRNEFDSYKRVIDTLPKVSE